MLGTAVVRPNRSSAGQRPIAPAGNRSFRLGPARFSSKASSKTWLASRPLRCSWCPPAEIAVNVSASPLRLACDNLRDRAGGDGTSALDGPLNVDLDVALSVLAGAVCASLRRRPPAITTPRPTPCNDGSCPPAARSPTGPAKWRQRPIADRIEDNEGARSRRLPADSHADRSVGAPCRRSRQHRTTSSETWPTASLT